MINDLWLNLPVTDIERSKEFFTKIGFTINLKHGNSEYSACLLIGKKNIVVMLFTESVFNSFTRHNSSDTKTGSEILISFDVESKVEIDLIAQKVEEAGGTIFGPPSEIQGWMYGCGFIDLDGHRWNALFMDYEKLNKSQEI